MAGSRADRIFIKSLEEIVETSFYEKDKDDDGYDHTDEDYNYEDDDNNNDDEASIITVSVQSHMRIRSLSWSVGDFEHGITRISLNEWRLSNVEYYSDDVSYY